MQQTPVIAAIDHLSSTQFATFFVDDLFFGIDVLNVQEVLRHQDLTSVPLAPTVVKGLINLRGQIVTAVDMRGRLGLPPREDQEAAMNMVVRVQEGAVSLLVDEIGDVLEVAQSTYERPPDNLEATARELIQGVFKLKDRLLLILDTERTVDVSSGFTAGLPMRKRGAEALV
ncbi:chemotaxis protein CheW [uncultured Paludibaculum sp.]|uniref:chemotaxis protein CheW n=1 Tax=uncultured Paludibaculum sp. TaxID=1765020 RepID=UPI002AAAC8C6|nr:chemotaxis protein CheW [uncultured Paludibaculum sp.]